MHYTIATAGGYQRADRSPEWLFRAVGNLVRRRPEIGYKLRMKFFGSWLHDDFSTAELERLGVAQLVEEVRPVPKPQLIAALAASQLLVTIPTQLWSRSIPGKLYEYWALGGPPVLLIDSVAGAPADLVRRHTLGSIVPQGDVAAIEAAIETGYDAWAAGRPHRISSEGSERFSRTRLALELEETLLGAMDPQVSGA